MARIAQLMNIIVGRSMPNDSSRIIISGQVVSPVVCTSVEDSFAALASCKLKLTATRRRMDDDGKAMLLRLLVNVADKCVDDIVCLGVCVCDCRG